MTKPLIYVAGPMSKGVLRDNVRLALAAADELLALSFAPLVPQLSHFWDLISPKEYEAWLDLDFEYLVRCNALLRLPGDSDGAVREVRFALAHNIPVFLSVSDLRAVFARKGCLA